MRAQQPYRLVTFLGKPAKGSYSRTKYLNPSDDQSEPFESEFVAEALFHFLQPQEIIILATDKAWEVQGDAILERFANESAISVRREQLPPGQTERELWSQFEVLKDALRLPEETLNRKVALDITHGFRSQPFFAAGAVMFLRLVDETPPDFSIYYGAWEAAQEGRTPIWDLTPLSDLISWSSHIMLFLKTGRAEGIASATEAIGRSLRKEWANAGALGEAPNLSQLGQALARFGGDLETVRTGSLMLKGSTTEKLHREINASHLSAQAIPPLADVLDRIRERIEPLITTSRLSEGDGLRSLQALARLYHEMGRFAEAAGTTREAYINQFACSLSDYPGQPAFSKEHRDAAELAWFEADENRAKEIGQVRNDITHAGYKKQPMPPDTIKNKINELIDGLDIDQ